MKLSVFLLPDGEMTVSEGLDYTHELGLHAFEPMFDAGDACPEEEQVALWIEKANALNIVIPCVSVGANLCAADAESEVDHLKNLAKIARRLGSPILHHTIYPPITPETRNEDFSDLLERALPRLREVWDACNSVGVESVYEFQGVQFNGRGNFAEMMRRLDRPAKIVLDTGNCAFMGETPIEQTSDYSGRIAHVHLKDFSFAYGGDAPERYRLPDGRILRREMLGQGDMQVLEVLKKLRKGNYNGWFSLECGKIEDFYQEERENIAWFIEQYNRWTE